jgi:hypothetical protein
LIWAILANSAIRQEVSSAINAVSATARLSRRLGRSSTDAGDHRKPLSNAWPGKAERNSLAAIERVKGVKEETVMAWLRIAAAHVERTCALLLANYKLTRAQLDAMWAYVGNKGEKGAMPRPTSVAPSGAA